MLLVPHLLVSSAVAQTLTQSMNESSKALAEAHELDRTGRYREARAQYLRAIRLDHTSREAFEQYALFLYSRGQFREGVKALRIGLEFNPSHTVLNAYLGMHLYRMGRVREAWVMMRAAQKDLGGRFVLQAILAQLSMILEEYPCAVRALTRYLETRPENLASKDFAFQIQLALALMRTGNLTAARQQLGLALAARPDSVRGQLARAELLLLNHQCRRSLDLYRRVMPRARVVRGLLQMGQAYLCLGRARDARRAATAYLRQYGRAHGGRRALMQGLLLLGDAAFRLEHTPEALQHFERAMALSDQLCSSAGRAGPLGEKAPWRPERSAQHEIAPDAGPSSMSTVGLRPRAGCGSDVQIRLRVAQARFALRLHEPALAALLPVVSRPDDTSSGQPPTAALILALRAAVRLGRTPLALQLADRLVARDRARSGGATLEPNVEHARGRALYWAGMAYNSAGRFEQAAKLLERAMEDGCRRPNPCAEVVRELVRAHAQQARRMLHTGAPEAALSLLRRALRLRPRSGPLLTDLSLVLLRLKRYPEALEQALTAHAVDPTSAGASRLAGRALAALGEHHRARVHLEQALARTADGAPRVRIMVEIAVFSMALGLHTEAINMLRQAQGMTATREHPALVSIVRRDRVRAHLRRGLRRVDRGSPDGVDDLLQASRGVALLPVTEQSQARTLVLLGLIIGGQQVRAREMLMAYNDHRYEIALRPEFQAMAGELLGALLDSFGSNAGALRRGARRLERLALTQGGDEGRLLADLAGRAHMRAAESLFNAGQYQEARSCAVRARRLLPPTWELRHNAAVIAYQAGGSREAALKELKAVSGKVPLALCNLAVLQVGAGFGATAHELFRRCARAGRAGRFEALRMVLEIQDQIFGARGP